MDIIPYLYGPAGTGKTTAAEHIAGALHLPFYFTPSVFEKLRAWEDFCFPDARLAKYGGKNVLKRRVDWTAEAIFEISRPRVGVGKLNHTIRPPKSPHHT